MADYTDLLYQLAGIRDRTPPRDLLEEEFGPPRDLKPESYKPQADRKRAPSRTFDDDWRRLTERERYYYPQGKLAPADVEPPAKGSSYKPQRVVEEFRPSGSPADRRAQEKAYYAGVRANADFPAPLDERTIAGRALPAFVPSGSPHDKRRADEAYYAKLLRQQMMPPDPAGLAAMLAPPPGPPDPLGLRPPDPMGLRAGPPATADMMRAYYAQRMRGGG